MQLIRSVSQWSNIANELRDEDEACATFVVSPMKTLDAIPGRPCRDTIVAVLHRFPHRGRSCFLLCQPCNGLSNRPLAYLVMQTRRRRLLRCLNEMRCLHPRFTTDNAYIVQQHIGRLGNRRLAKLNFLTVIPGLRGNEQLRIHYHMSFYCIFNLYTCLQNILPLSYSNVVPSLDGAISNRLLI